MIVHPAFTFGDEEIEGFWTAKFEASMVEENLSTIANNNVIDKTVRILPNVDSWKYIQMGNAFKVSLNMKENNIYRFPNEIDTHLVKNNEWGAVTYLSVSQYGKVPAKNTSGVTQEPPSGENTEEIFYSYTGAGDYIANIIQSTTGNITGIYDMNGGVWEYVAAYWDNGSDSIQEYGTQDIFPNNKLNSKYSKYFDVYEVGDTEKQEGKEIWDIKSTEGNEKSYQIAKDRVDLMKNVKGDAISEAMDEWSYYGRYANAYNSYGVQYGPYEFLAWLRPTIDSDGKIVDIGETTLWNYGVSLYGNDNILIGTYYFPFLFRGGDNWSGNYTGLFDSSGWYGRADRGVSFRVVICV